MSIHAFLNGEAFDPEAVKAMSVALAEACGALGLREKGDAITRLLARRIIDHARDDIHDAELLKAAALKGFRH